MRSSTIILAIILALCAGCGQPRAPAADPVKAQANQNAAEADSGMAAAKAKLGAALTPELADILDGSAAFARATIGKDAAPAATWPVERIVADPAGFHAAGASAERHANGSWNLWALGVAAMAVMPALLYAAKFIPGCGPLIETVGTGLWTTFASRATKDQEKARDTLKNLHRLWHRPVHIETMADERGLLLSFDGGEHKQTWL